MATETLPASRDREEPETTPSQRRDAVVIIGAGNNTKNMERSVANLAVQHPVHVFEVNEPLIPVQPDHLHMTNTEEGRRSASQLLGSGAVHATYLSTVAWVRKDLIPQHVDLAARKVIDFTVTTKPVAEDLPTAFKLRDTVRAAEEYRKQLDPSYDPEVDPLIYVHEHYREKGAWHALREQLGHIVDTLGRVESMAISIQEARPMAGESEIEGTFMDLSPHTISLTLDMQAAINTSERYRVPNRSTTSIERFRHEGSELGENIDTGFIVRGQNTMVDTQRGKSHDVDFIWYAGKCLIDKKDIVITFVHPDTGERSTITVDLIKNSLSVPTAVSHLFPISEIDEHGYGHCSFEDNGYGFSVESGLNGGDPHRSFQSLDEAIIVAKWQQALQSKIKNIAPTICPQGVDLLEFAQR